MTDDSYSHVPATVTVPTASLVEQLRAIDEENLADRRMCAEAEARIAAREAVALPIRMILGIAAPKDDEVVIQPTSLGRVSLAKGPRGPKLTHKYMSLKVLSDSAKPMKVVEIVRRVADQFRKPVERTSLSPLLAKLLEAKLVEHDKNDACWRITEKGRTALAEIEGAAR